MLYLAAIFVPFVVFFQSGKPGLGLCNLCLWLTCCGAPFATGWAFFEANQYLQDERTSKIVDAVSRSRRRRD